MSEKDHNIGKCRCCLKTGRFKNIMWNAFVHDGKRETYGNMLAECFTISLQQSTDHLERICGSCAKRLVDAFSFKKLVLASDKLLLQFSNDLKTEVINKEEFKQKSHEESESKEENVQHLSSPKGDMKNEEVSEIEKECLEEYNSTTESEAIDGTRYLEVEFIEDGNTETRAPSTPGKWSRKKKNCGRLKKLMYTEEELREAMAAVESKRMTRAQASVYYNISLKNLRWKMREANKADGPTCGRTCTRSQSNPEPTKPETAENKPKAKPVKRELSEKETLNRKNFNNIRLILLSSNATPVQGHHGRGYTCCFCPEQYQTPAQLKTHTLQAHKEARNEYMKTKDAWEFCVKLDITGLRCELCAKQINSLDALIHHLVADHDLNIYLDAVKQIIPFKFDGDELCCAICREEFQFFKLLSQHMNEHYMNYTCKICDRGFVNKSSLRTHEYRHQYGEFRCTYCRKEFTTAIRKRDHERAVHRMNCRTHKCGYCDEKFADAAGRYKHETAAHGIEPRLFKCKACDSCFARQTSLTDHLNAYHLQLKQHECSICNKAFLRKKTLKRHMLTHTSVKDFKCNVCGKDFSRKSGLVQHLRIHTNDRKYKCEHCGSGFVQRVTLKHHLRSKHGVLLAAGDSSTRQAVDGTPESTGFTCVEAMTQLS